MSISNLMAYRGFTSLSNLLNRRGGTSQPPSSEMTYIGRRSETEKRALLPPSDQRKGEPRSCWSIVKKDVKRFLFSAIDWLWKFEKKEEQWLETIRGFVATIAGLIATMSFAAGLAPPGGVVSVALGDHLKRADKSLNESIAGKGKEAFNATGNVTLHGGEAVMGIVFPTDYNSFQNWNSLCMYLSLIIFFLMMSGVTVKHHFMIWFCSMLMCLDILAVGMAFSKIISMTSPSNVWMGDAQTREVLINIWLISMSVFMALLTIRTVFWCVTNLMKRTLSEDGDEEAGTSEVTMLATTGAVMQGTSGEVAAVQAISEEEVLGTSGGRDA